MNFMTKILSKLAYRKSFIQLADKQKQHLVPYRNISLHNKHLKRKRDNPFNLNPSINHSIKSDTIGLYGYFLLSIPIGTFILGIWQVKRRKWKLDLIENLNTRISADPIELPEDLQELQSKEYYSVKVKGRFLYDNELLLGPRSLIVDGRAASEGGGNIISSSTNVGYCIITPFQVADRDLTILVNRGWVPKHYKKYFQNNKKPSSGTSETVEITGIIRLNEKRPAFVGKNMPSSGVWQFRDLEAMSEMTGASPVYLDQVMNESNKTPGNPKGGQTRVTLRNEHMSYIITWFGLSGSTAYIWYKWIYQKVYPRYI